jgi:type II secretory pathway pseudopilin PulG
MSLEQADIDMEARKQAAESLLIQLRLCLADMRSLLEAGHPAEAIVQRDIARLLFVQLGKLLNKEGLLETASHGGTDAEALQAFRRAAGLDLEKLESRYRFLCSREWRSVADEKRDATVRRTAWSWALWLSLASVLLAVWWGWQWSRQEAARAEINTAKSVTASQAVKLVSMTAWLAQKTQNKPLSAFARDMTAECSGIDVRQTLPNHPCREAWVYNRHSIFKASIPSPGQPIDAPSEIFFDPWGAPYLLLIPATGLSKIVSAGPDGRLGTPDDVGVDIPYWRLGEDGGRDRQ